MNVLEKLNTNNISFSDNVSFSNITRKLNTNRMKYVLALFSIMFTCSFFINYTYFTSIINSYNRIFISLSISLMVLCYNRFTKNNIKINHTENQFKVKCDALANGYIKLNNLRLNRLRMTNTVETNELADSTTIKSGFASINLYIDVHSTLMNLKLDDVIVINDNRAYVNVNETIHNERNREIERMINSLEREEIVELVRTFNLNSNSNLHTKMSNLIYQWLVIKIRIVLTQLYALRENLGLIELNDYDDLMSDIKIILRNQYDDKKNNINKEIIDEKLKQFNMYSVNMAIWINITLIIMGFIDSLHNNMFSILSAPLWTSLVIITFTLEDYLCKFIKVIQN